MIDFIGISTSKELVFFLFLFAAFVFSFFLRAIIFHELDYYEIKYTQRTKRRTLWLIYVNLIGISFWLHVLHRLLLLM
jgi:hypothetical protein